MIELNRIICGDSLQVLKTLPDACIDMCMTSPPYYALRDYQTAKWEGGQPDCNHAAGKERSRYDYSLDSSPIQNGARTGTDAAKWKDVCPSCGAMKVDHQLGIEPTFQEYIGKLCDIFDQVHRVLKPEGSCWVNLADTYWGGNRGAENKYGDNGERCIPRGNENKARGAAFKDKCLCQIPARFAIEMTNRGWILRNTIIWYKRSCMPSSVTDRFTVDFEYLYFFVKQGKYYFEQQRETSVDPEIYIPRRPRHTASMAAHDLKNYQMAGSIGDDGILKNSGKIYSERNKRCVWDITTRGFKEAHFATYPEELCMTPIKAGCPEFVCNKCGKAREKIYERKRLNRTELPADDVRHRPHTYHGAYEDINGKGDAGYSEVKEMGYSDCGCNAGFHPGSVLDPFAGAGTTCLVARKQGRDYIGIELSEKYAKMATNRIHNSAGLL